MNLIKQKFVITRVGEVSHHGYAERGNPLQDPSAVCQYWRTVIEAQPDHERDKELLIAILVGTRLHPIGYHEISRGTISESLAHPREVMRPALVAAAHRFILVHNHPSGDPSPSESDRRLTRRIREAGELLQVELLDHIIIGDPSYYSFRESALL